MTAIVKETAEWIQRKNEGGKPGIELTADELETLIKKARGGG